LTVDGQRNFLKGLQNSFLRKFSSFVKIEIMEGGKFIKETGMAAIAIEGLSHKGNNTFAVAINNPTNGSFPLQTNKDVKLTYILRLSTRENLI
jgi:hypothetical protein